MATSISSTFDIVTELAAGTGTTNIANPGRAFRVVGIYGTGLDTATLTVSKVANAGAGAATQMGVVTVAALVTGLDDAPAVLDAAADRDVAETDALRIVRAVANSTRCIIRCAASGGGEALTES
jgi:hypothetical protein